MDDIDLAQGEEDFLRRLALRDRQSVLPPTGKCYNCSEPLPEGRVFCDQYCEEDYRKTAWQKGQRA